MESGVEEFSLRWNNHHDTLVTVLDKLLQRETFVDVILAAEGQFIKAHRIVLCVCSQYFEVMLFGRWANWGCTVSGHLTGISVRCQFYEF